MLSSSPQLKKRSIVPPTNMSPDLAKKQKRIHDLRTICGPVTKHYHYPIKGDPAVDMRIDIYENSGMRGKINTHINNILGSGIINISNSKFQSYRDEFMRTGEIKDMKEKSIIPFVCAPIEAIASYIFSKAKIIPNESKEELQTRIFRNVDQLYHSITPRARVCARCRRKQGNVKTSMGVEELNNRLRKLSIDRRKLEGDIDEMIQNNPFDNKFPKLLSARSKRRGSIHTNPQTHPDAKEFLNNRFSKRK